MIALYAFDHELARAGRVTSQPLMAEIRLTWWSEALGEIADGRAVRRHPTAQALAEAMHRRKLPRQPLDAAIEAWSAGDPAAAAGAVAEAAALTLDPAVETDAARIAGRAWREPLTAEARAASRRLSAAAFPAVAHAALGRGPEPIRRARLTWSVLQGSL